MKKIITLCLSLCMTAALAAPAYALEYSIAPPKDFDFGRDTSIEVIHTADGGAMRNEDVSKNAALIPPAFGSESMNALHTGEYLTPNLAPRTLPTAGAVISGSGDVVTPGSTVNGGSGYQPSVLFTDVTSNLYYKNGSLGKIEIPALDLSVRIYQGTDSKTLAKGVGHFEDTSIWEGNVCLAAHNRGANSYFGQIHTLDIGDKITLTTKLGTRSYINLYNIWSSYAVESEGVMIAYTSVYGNTKKAVEYLAEELKAKGCPKVVVCDLAREDMAEAVEDAFRYGKLVLATTTYNGDIFPFMRTFIDHLTERNFQNRKIALVENGSWAPVAAKVMAKALEGSKNIELAGTVTIRGTLKEENRRQLAELAAGLMQ